MGEDFKKQPNLFEYCFNRRNEYLLVPEVLGILADRFFSRPVL